MHPRVNILLVDDEARNLDALEAILESPDYHLVRAQNADESLRALVSLEFAVLVLDIHMPETSGFELAQLIKRRKKYQHIPIIFLTAYYQDDEHILQAYATGAVDFLSKPCNSAILRSKVAVFVELFRKSRALEAEIEERKRADETLRESEAKFRGILESAPDAIVIVDQQGQIELVNSQAERLFGYRREELIHQPVEMLLPERYREQHVPHRMEYCAAPHPRPMGIGLELFGRRKDGTEFPVEISLGPLATPHGVLVSSAIRDVTKRKESEEALKRVASELARSNAELEQFAHVASHDLQEPLRMVASATQLLARDYGDKLGPEAAQFINYAVEGAKWMQRLINGLLNYSRLGAGRKPFEPVDCQTIYDAAVVNLKAVIDESGAVLTHDNLPTVMGDGVQLIQLFQNLLANAIKFRGQDPPAIQVLVTREEAGWQFVVRDNGIGIDPKNFDRLFVIFQRLHTREDYPGTGIGLAVCKKIVEQHGGRIWVMSTPGKGSAFHFTIPMVNETG